MDETNLSETRLFEASAFESSLKACLSGEAKRLQLDPPPDLRSLDILGANLRLTVAADALGIDAKLALEQALLEVEAPQSLRAFHLQIFFVPSENFQAPSPLQPFSAPEASAFGIKRQLRPIPGVASVWVIASGKGGVGKSTVSANFASLLATKGFKVGLLDADIYGPSIPHMMHEHNLPQIDAQGRLVPREAYGLRFMSLGLLSGERDPAIWRGPMVAKAVRQLMYDVTWGSLDHLVIDLPPGTGDVQLTILETLPVAGAFVVTTPARIALLDAHKAISMFEQLGIRILGVVENMSFHHCSACGQRDHIFGKNTEREIEEGRGIDIIARIPLTPDLYLGGDEGRPAVVDNPLVADWFESMIHCLDSRP